MKHVWIGILIVTIAVLAAGAASAQTMGPGGQGGYEQPAGQGWFCPYCGSGRGYTGGGPGWGRGSGMMGPGMMGPGYGYGGRGGMMGGQGPGYGYGGRGGMMGGQGPGMMHRWGGGGSGYGPMQRGWQGDQGYAPGRGPGYGYQGPEEPLDKEGARGIVERYLSSSRNPNLKVGEIEEKDDVFEAEIVTRKGGDLVDRVQIDRQTGWMRSVYE